MVKNTCDIKFELEGVNEYGEQYSFTNKDSSVTIQTELEYLELTDKKTKEHSIFLVSPNNKYIVENRDYSNDQRR